MVNTLINLPPEVNEQIVMQLLSRPQRDNIAHLGNFYVRLDQNGGQIGRQSRYDNLPTQPVPLGPSGANPPPMILNRLDTDVELQWFGGYVSLTEQVMLINQDPVLEETVDLLAQSMAETDDQLQFEHMVNSSAFVNAVYGTNGDNPTNATRRDFDEVYQALRGANARRIVDEIEGDLKFGTGPVRRAYFAKTDTDMISDLEQIRGYRNVADYPSQENILEAEECAIGNFRVFLSSAWPVTASASGLGADVHNIICQGMEAVSIVELDGYSVQYRYTPKEIAGGPLWLRGTSGYIFAQAPKITNTSWIINHRVTLRA